MVGFICNDCLMPCTEDDKLGNQGYMCEPCMDKRLDAMGMRKAVEKWHDDMVLGMEILDPDEE